MKDGPTLALIGSGPIAGAHLAAARWAGFRVMAVAGRPGSGRAQAFALEHGIPDVWSDPGELASAGHWDALVLAVSPAATLPLLIQSAARGKPILVEKPVALASRDLGPYLTRWPNAIVGYNRRYYTSVRAAKEFVDRQGPCLVQVQIPESVAGQASTVEERESAVRSNSVHAFDLMRYLFGNLSVESVASLGRPDEYRGRVVTLRSARGDICCLVANWNSPANFTIDIHADDERFELRPFEVGRAFHGMDVLDPTPEVPIRRYVPKCAQVVNPDDIPGGMKPGFARQALALRAITEGRELDPEVATMRDAYEALILAEAVLRGTDESAVPVGP